MNRDELLDRIETRETPWDIIVIGGGATGAGIAVDASSRGYQTLLLEQHDFAAGTSGRSTKLAHGGVRYLRQGNFSLVMEALKERALMLQNAPHLVHGLPFVIPNYTWWEIPYYGLGLRLYDLLAGKDSLGRSKMLSKKRTLERIPTIEPKGLTGGVIYHDGQFDDSRMVINLVQTAAEKGGVPINYMKVTGLKKTGDSISGVEAKDVESGKTYSLDAKAVINATGAFCDGIRTMDDERTEPIVRPSQGAHIVLDRSFLPGQTAIMIPRTDDGRLFFAIPWHECIVIGTTETPVGDVTLDPQPLEKEIDFLLEHAARYLTKTPSRSDVLSAFAGIRPLVGKTGVKNTATLSRDHWIDISRSGLVTITGGKWTTYRRMAEDCVNRAAALAHLDDSPCVTKELKIHGYHQASNEFGDLAVYGSDAPAILDLIESNPRYRERIHPDRTVRVGELVWAVRHEMVRTVEDFLIRRTRSLLLGAEVSMQMAPTVAERMAEELGHDEMWKREQINAYQDLARKYMPR